MYMILTQSIEDFPGKTDISRTRETANKTHLLLILTWLEILVLLSLYSRRCACLKVNEPTDNCMLTLSLFCRLFQSSLLFLFCMHVLHGICMHMCMHGVMCTCVNVCRSQRSVSNVFHFFWEWLSHWPWSIPIQQDYLSSSSWYSPVSASPVTATFSFLHGAGDQKQDLNKHSKHITNQTVSLAFLPSLWTLTNPSTVFTSYTQAVHTSCAIPSGVENVTNPPA